MVATYEQLKEALQDHRKTLLAELADIDSRKGEQMIGYETHQADAATRAFDQAADLALRNNTAKMLREVEDALARFDKGNYGVCQGCGDKIDIARLEAIPHTGLCLRCAETRDFRANRYS
ncbi:MAG: TraR/DksA C4-type zinc finger protein [Anaerolineae bacterium]|nr:TraR/DksA C4-type zinc finger protein [Anaerolineae bacterium]